MLPDEEEEWSPYLIAESYAIKRGFRTRGGHPDVSRAGNHILRDALDGGKVILSFPPPPASWGSMNSIPTNISASTMTPSSPPPSLACTQSSGSLMVEEAIIEHSSDSSDEDSAVRRRRGFLTRRIFSSSVLDCSDSSD